MRPLMLLTLSLLLSGCSVPEKIRDSPPPKGKPQEDEISTNDAGQKIVEVPYADMNSWFKQRKTVKIVSICSISRADGSHDLTTSFLIVYEVVSPTKCHSCGQTLPAERPLH